MLAEIYLLRLESLLRASEEATPTENSRFVPLNPDPAFFSDVQIKCDREEHLDKWSSKGVTGNVSRCGEVGPQFPTAKAS